MNFEDERLGFGGFAPRPGGQGGFKPREKNESSFAPKAGIQEPAFKPQTKFTPATQAAAKPGFVSDDLNGLEAGMEVMHEKFGKGKVVFVDGRAGEKKATVLFDMAGQKQLLLKFAKLKIIQS